MTFKMWNWLLKNWPNFTYDKDILKALEYQFSQNSGTVLGVLKHIKKDSKDDLLVEILSNEALKTAEIEGGFLNRESVQSSIKRSLGLKGSSLKTCGIKKKHDLCFFKFQLCQV